MPEALIHVGIHKTGTTSIQRAFFEGRHALAESGILYPLLAGKANHFDFYTCFCDAPLAYRMVKARGIDNLQQLQDLQNNIRREFESQLDAAPKQRVILSSEALSLMNAGEMGRFVSYLSERGLKPLKFIVYLRDYASYWESIVQQDVKGGAYLDFADEEVNLRRLRMYRPFLEALRVNAPRESINVRIFHRPSLKDGDVVADFFAQADVSGIPVLDRISIRRYPGRDDH